MRIVQAVPELQELVRLEPLELWNDWCAGTIGVGGAMELVGVGGTGAGGVGISVCYHFILMPFHFSFRFHRIRIWNDFRSGGVGAFGGVGVLTPPQ